MLPTKFPGNLSYEAYYNAWCIVMDRTETCNSCNYLYVMTQQLRKLLKPLMDEVERKEGRPIKGFTISKKTGTLAYSFGCFTVFNHYEEEQNGFIPNYVT